MRLKINVSDPKNMLLGNAVMKLDYASNQWSIEQDPNQVWSKVSSNTKGNLKVQTWGMIWVQDPVKERLLAVIQHGPMNEGDKQHTSGVARIHLPDNDAFRDVYFKWQADAAAPAPAPEPQKELSKIRKKAQDLCRAAFNPKGKMFTHGSPKPGTKNEGNWDPTLAKVTYERKEGGYAKGYTSCGAMASFLSAKLGRGSYFTIESVWKMYKDQAAWWVNATKQNLPKPGDVYVLLKPSGDFSHIGVVVEASKTMWETADTGQAPDGFSGGRRDRAYNQDQMKLAGEPVQSKEDRVVAGWVNINYKGLFKDSDGTD
ncbi:MAG: hypothetical protein JNL98_02885 [Bryobacterales bacterium]|nr:hypothetical protein [Bryobacterales bacterium]